MPADGEMDFSTYSLSQLRDLRHAIDATNYPRNHANLVAELERRETVAVAPSFERYPGRFSARDGWLGWIDAKVRRSPVYGEGSLDPGVEIVTLQGLQRTWLGMVVPHTQTVPAGEIRNVGAVGEWVDFEWKRRLRLTRRLRFRARSAAAASALVDELPARQSGPFQRHWAEIARFQQRLDAVSGRNWLVPILVL